MAKRYKATPEQIRKRRAVVRRLLRQGKWVGDIERMVRHQFGCSAATVRADFRFLVKEAERTWGDPDNLRIQMAEVMSRLMALVEDPKTPAHTKVSANATIMRLLGVTAAEAELRRMGESAARLHARTELAAAEFADLRNRQSNASIRLTEAQEELAKVQAAKGGGAGPLVVQIATADGSPLDAQITESTLRELASRGDYQDPEEDE